jgi:hypothetical protein
MPYMIREASTTAQPSLGSEPTLAVLARTIPAATLRAVVAAQGVREQRRRKLPADLLLALTVAMNLEPAVGLEAVLRRLLSGLRLRAPDPDVAVPTRSAICQARARLGARPVVDLFHRVCRPLATAATPGACRFGLRLVALDGTVENVPDTPANERAFGRGRNQHQPTAFPQVRGVYLSECGPHTIIDAGFWPIGTSEHTGAHRLVRSVTAEMLVLCDRGLYSFALAARVRARGAHVLGRVPAGVRLVADTPLADGSVLAWWRPADRGRGRRGRRATQQVRVRVITYTLQDPARPGYGERHRLVTTLRDPVLAPARDLVETYHERWEIELCIDELDTNQRQRAPLRSQTPVGVLQELSGLLVAHYAVRAAMHEAAVAAPPPPLDPRRLSFTQAVRLIVEAIPHFHLVAAADHLRLYARLLADIRRHPLPARRVRTYPRVCRQRRSRYPPKRAHHRHPVHPPTTFREAIVILN